MDGGDQLVSSSPARIGCSRFTLESIAATTIENITRFELGQALGTPSSNRLIRA